MNFKPIITYKGSVDWFRKLEEQIINDLPLDTCEWKRTFQRPVKQVRLEATFQPFDKVALEKYKRGEWSIATHPILHLYVTECNDIDNYKKSVHEEINAWLNLLSAYDVWDWMIVLVETIDVRKTKNLLQRTTVLDKIRIDFGSKNVDRCISVLYPAKQKATESFRCLLQRIRYLMMVSYNRNIAKYEELLRSKKEKRNHNGWDFFQYFCMQEDLAIVLEKFELFTEALIQYDELDAVFSQFITNTGFSNKHKWLEYFKRPLTSFHSICLRRKHHYDIRTKFYMDGITLLEYRNYLFERQAYLLQQSNNVTNIATRLLNFLFGTMREIELLKLEYQEGALACWQFVAALEVLQICEQSMEPQEVACFQYCAPIWNLAKDKLYELGKLCGLLPGCTATSDQLHIVVQLSAGIGDYPIDQEELNDLVNRQHREISPAKKLYKSAPQQLKEALSSNLAFQNLYLELAELAISTYKHISRLRSARLVGLDLGNFYCALDQPHKAVGFFTDLLRELRAENWPALYAQTLIELANCYRKMGDVISYTKTCSAISSCSELEMLVRTFYFDEFLKSLKNLTSTLSAQPTLENAKFSVLEDNFQIISLQILNTKPIIQDDLIKVQLKLESLYPRGVIADELKLSFERVNTTLPENQLSVTDSKRPLRRSSSIKRKLSPSVQSDFSNYLGATDVSLQPGINYIELQAKSTRVGEWILKQLRLRMSELEFLSEELPFKAEVFEITTKPASAALHFKTLITGIEQTIRLHVSGGSFVFPTNAKITLKCSKGLRIRLKNPQKEVENLDNQENPDEDSLFESILEVPLLNFQSFEERDIALEVLTEMPGRKITKYVEHQITLSCPWSRNDLIIRVEFQPAIEASCHLHSCGTQKFLQIILTGLEAHLYLSDARISCEAAGVRLIDLNPTNQQQRIEIYKSLTVFYLYEIQVEPLKTEIELPLIKVQFLTKYSSIEKPYLLRNFICSFDLIDYITLFRIQAQLEPNELCRLRSVCNLNLKITKVHDNPYENLMYEVLTDQNLWAVCGRSSGVISMKDVNSHTISLDVMPLSTGFLPMPSIRLSKYTPGGKNKNDLHSKVHPFPPGQLYNSTKSIQIHVIATAVGEFNAIN